MALLKIHRQSVADGVTKLLNAVEQLEKMVAAQDDITVRVNLQMGLFSVYGDLAYVIGLLGSVTDAKEVKNAIDARYKPSGGEPEHSRDDAVGATAAAGGSSRTQ